MSALLGGTGPTVAGRAPEQAADTSDTDAALKQAFLYPPHGAKPMTRWWWFGGAATPEEITRELTMMRDAGLRGVELQPVYPVAVDNKELGIRNTRYFSPAWFSLLRHTLAETKRLGLQFDFTLGSGWPYGGPFIPGRLAAQKITVLSRDAQGPDEFTWPLYPYLTGDGRVFAVVAAPVVDSGALDLTRSTVLNAGHHGAVRWSVPAGHWRVMAFTDSLTGQLVKRPTLGMEGYVIDHFDEKALDLFLDAVGVRTIEELHSIADPPFHSVFCDSLEVYGADWTPSFMEEFRSRRGYDLAPCLPALWQDAGEATPGIRYDYHLTLSELIVNHFFRRLQAWSSQRGMTARIQAHGAMGDVMQGYAAADIPEGEEGLDADRYAVIIDHRRLASAAAHVHGKPVVSCESYTWLRQPRYLVTLEEMKGATDSSFLDGINQIVNQGYSYSPPQAGEPGWVFYAATMVNHNNIWWPHYKYLAAYIQRTAAVLLKGASVNPIAVYLPLADIYAHYGLGSLTMDTEIQRRLGLDLFMDLRRAGYDFDLINDDALSRVARVEDGKLKASTAEYSVTIIPGVEFMPPESLERLAEFARGGGMLIFTERLPQTGPGLKQRESGTRRLRDILNGIFPAGQGTPGSVQAAGRGRAVLAPDRTAAVEHVRAALAPDFQIVKAGDGQAEALERAVENAGFAHRRVGETDFYFISNISPFEQRLRIRFAAGHRAPERWNPEDGSIEETLAFEYVDSSHGPVTEVGIRLDPFESCFVVFARDGAPVITSTNLDGPLRVERSDGGVHLSGIARRNGEYFAIDRQGKTRRASVAGLPDPISIAGPWRLTLGDSAPLTLAQLLSWSEFAQGKNYSGWGIYESGFEMAGDDWEKFDWTLDLGSVHETAEVTLNGFDLGAAWKGARRLSCGNALKQGSNQVQVRVGNLWIQKVTSLPPPDLKPVAETFGIRWGLYGRTRISELPPSGLLGPVRLLPFRRIAIAL
ncbi:MAG: glycosyl hydrolase [Terriglobia bacterium]